MRIETLCTLIAGQLQKPLEEVRPTARLAHDLGVDSLEMKSLLLSIDDACGVMPEAHQLRGVKTVADLHGLVLRLLGPA